MKANPDRETVLFEEAIRRGGSDRVAYLDGACQGDPDLRR